MKDYTVAFNGWFVVPKGASVHKCPQCKRSGYVPFTDQHELWLDQDWSCPNCGHTVTSKTMDENKE